MKVLAAARFPLAAEAVAPVAKELRKLGHDVVVIGVHNDSAATRRHGGSAAVFERQNLPFVQLSDWGYTGDSISVPDSIAQTLITSIRPHVIVAGCSRDATGDHNGIEEALIAAAAKHSIRAVQIVGSWDAWYPRKEPVLASTYACMDAFSQRVLETRGVPGDQIVITGNPALDKYATAMTIDRQPRRQELGIGDSRVLVYFGQPSHSFGIPDTLTTLHWTINALQPLDKLIFARHPRDQKDYSGILRHANEQLVATAFNGEQLLSIADVALTHYSTMSLKSSLLDIPTINILLDNDLADIRALFGGFPLSLMGGSTEVHTEAELNAALAGEIINNGTALKEALQMDGNAGQRVVQVTIG